MAFAPFNPTSSSGVKATYISPWGMSLFLIRIDRASIIMAIAALLSAPRTLLPSENNMSFPMCFSSSGFVWRVMCLPSSCIISLPSYASTKIGWTIGERAISDVSKWEIQPMVGEV